MLTAGISSFLFIYSYQPFPLTNGQSYSYVLQTIDATFGNLPIWGGHPPLVPLLLGMTSSLYNIQPFYLWSGSNFILQLLYPFLLYLVTYSITKNRLISCFAGIISLFLCGSSFLLGSTAPALLFILFPIGMFFASKLNIKEIRWHTIFFVTFFLFCIQLLLIALGTLPILRLFILVGVPLIALLFAPFYRQTLFLGLIPLLIITGIAHPYQGIMITALVSSYIIVKKIKNNWSLKLKFGSINILAIIGLLLLLFGATLFLGLITFQDNFVFTRWLFGDAFDGTAYDITSVIKFDRLITNYGTLWLFLGLVSMSLIFLINNFRFNKDFSVDMLPLAFCGAICFIAYFLPDGHLTRMSPYFNLFFSILISYLLLKVCGKKFKSKIELRVRQKKFMIDNRLLYFVLMIVIIVPIFNSYQTTTIQTLVKANPENYYSYIQTYEVETFDWITKNTSNDSIIVSDPYTMYMMRQLTGRDVALLQKTLFIYDRSYSTESLEAMSNLRDYVFCSGNSGFIYSEVQKMNYSQAIIILSERTATWINSGRNFPQLPTARISSSMLSGFLNEEFFNLRYSKNNKIYVFEPVANASLESFYNTFRIGLSFNELSGFIVNNSGFENTSALIKTSRTEPNWVEGISGKSLNFNPLYKDYVVLPQTGNLDGLDSITITLWIKNNVSDFTGSRCLVSKPAQDSKNYMEQPYFIEISKDCSIRFGIRDGTKNIFDLRTPDYSFNNDEWTFIAATWTGDIAKIYVNGVSVSEVKASGIMCSSGEDLQIGLNALPQQANPRFFSGSIDEFRLYSRALVHKEIIDLFTSRDC